MYVCMCVCMHVCMYVYMYSMRDDSIHMQLYSVLYDRQHDCCQCGHVKFKSIRAGSLQNLDFGLDWTVDWTMDS